MDIITNCDQISNQEENVKASVEKLDYKVAP